MPRFQVLYLSSQRGEAFRDRAPGKPPYVLRRSHYKEGPSLVAESPYDLWQKLRLDAEKQPPESPRPLDVGDALESDNRLLLCNYWGFDAAEWRNGPRSTGSAETAAEGKGHMRRSARPDV